MAAGPGRAETGANGPADLLQVWFPGVRCAVGGGYPDADSGLSKLALQWMLDEAQAHGLIVDPERCRRILGGELPYVRPDPKGMMQESLTWLWKPAEYVPKRHSDWRTRQVHWRANRARRRGVPEGAVMHWSVHERGAEHVATLGLPPDTTVYPKCPG